MIILHFDLPPQFTYELFHICFTPSIQTVVKRSYLIFEGISSCWRDLMKVWAFERLESFSVFSLSYLADLILLAKEIVYFNSFHGWRGKTPRFFWPMNSWIQLVWPSKHFMSSIETLKSDHLSESCVWKQIISPFHTSPHHPWANLFFEPVWHMT